MDLGIYTFGDIAANPRFGSVATAAAPISSIAKGIELWPRGSLNS